MSKRIGPTDWETRLCKKLGVEYSTIDETHKYLLKSLPFYEKVNLLVFSPIHSSIDYIHQNVCVDPESDPSESTEDAKKEIDFAELIEAEGCSITLLNALVAALAPSGLKLVRGLYRSIRDGSNKTNSLEAQKELAQYLVEANSSDDTDIEFEGSRGTGPSPTDHSLSSSVPSSTSTEINPEELKFETLADRYENPESRIPTDFNEAEGLPLGLDISTILAGIELPSLEERSPWENSFLEKVDFMSKDQYQVVHFIENGNDAGYTERNSNIIKFFMARKLQDVFNLAEDDVLINKFDAWLVRDVLLQGHIFITRDAICFYLLLPGKVQNHDEADPDVALYEGSLGQGESSFISGNKTNVWAILRPQTLSLYSSPSQLYFPSKVISLRSALYCQLIEPPTVVASQLKHEFRTSNPSSGIASPQTQSETSSLSELQDEEETVLRGTWFKIVCTDKVYKFQTQGIYSARHWVIALTKVIFTLRNTNKHQETILKVPLEEVLDYHKKYVLVDEEAPKDIESPLIDNAEKAVAFFMSYNLPVKEVNKNLEELHFKTVIDEDLLTTSDSVSFLLFHGGNELFLLVESVFDAHMNQKVESSINSCPTPMGRTGLFRTYQPSKYNQVTSSLQPEFLSGTSIINKIESVNYEIQKYRQEQYYMYKDGKIIGPHNEEIPYQEKAKRVMKVLAFSDRFFSHPHTERELITSSNASLVSDYTFESGDETCESFEEVWEMEEVVNLPKPFTVQMIKSSGMQICAQRRDIKDVVVRYHVLMNNEEEEAESDDRSYISTTQVTKNLSNEAPIQKSTKFGISSARIKLVKRSIKTVSTIGGIWSAKPEHFGSELLKSAYFVSDVRERVKAVDRFRKHFSLGPDEILVASYFGHIKRSVPIYGRLYIGNNKLYFKSLLPGVSTKMILPFKSIQNYSKGKKKESHYFSEALNVKGLGDVLFEFGKAEHRDDFHNVLKIQFKEESKLSSENPSNTNTFALKPQENNSNPDLLVRSRIRVARLRLLEDKVSVASGIDFPLIIEDNPVVFTEVVTSNPYNIVLLTIGSRGDVQPYIALGKELLKEGHNVTIATHNEFKGWINKHGIKHKELAGDPAELMQLMVTHGSLSVAFLKEAHSKFKDWISSLLETSWKACQGADMIIESPSAMSGIHIAEALGIPYMRAFTMPWTRSRAYPHAFIVPEQKRGGSYNLLTHVMFENIFWKGISGQVNSWREKQLGLPRTNLAKLQQSRIPFLYNVSPSILPPSTDFPDWVKVTGYWFLNEGSEKYQPPQQLVEFLEKAKHERKKIVYIGFGSIVVSDANALTQTIVDSVQELGVMCILNKGWSDRLTKQESTQKIELPPTIYDSGSIPHDWLFPRIDAAVHHGGSGTTGASLRAGLPTIIKPFFGDQFFYASRIEELGVGLGLKNLNQKSFTKALKNVVSETKYQMKAKEIASSMSRERGVLTAVEAIYTEMAYARSLMLNIKRKTKHG